LLAHGCIRSILEYLRNSNEYRRSLEEKGGSESSTLAFLNAALKWSTIEKEMFSMGNALDQLGCIWTKK
jgi:hypothetical protein